MVRSVVLLAMGIVLAVPAAAQAYWELAPDGHPLITTSQYSPDGVQLFVCPPGETDTGACVPQAWTQGEYRPGPTPPGTTFKVRWRDGREEQSPAWQGQVQRTALPTLSGRLYATGDAQPQAGAWTGGWGDDVSRLSLAACGTAAGTDCVPLPQISGCPVPCDTVASGTAVSSGGLAGIPTALSGRYLFALETRVPRDQRGWPIPVPALWGLSWSYDLPAPTALGSVSAPVGPLGLPSPAVIVEPVVTAPVVKLRSRALRSKGRISVGRVTCQSRCKVAVKVSGGGERAYTTTFVADSRGKAITAPARRGKLTVRVHVDGKLLANATVRAR
ncbi:hypothetical protein OJ998_21795 [Solirubrobacter taibaiensis]|nr:hypothetical protein [Solirubrobacter taibaiensis]